MSNETIDTSPIVLLRTLQQRKLMLLLFSIVAIGLAASSTDVRHKLVNEPIVYKAKMTLLISPPPPKRNRSEEQTSEIESWFASEDLVKQLVLSEDVVTRAARVSEYDGDWRSLRNNVRVLENPDKKSKNDKSFLITFEVTADTPEAAQKQANSLGDEVIEYTQEMVAGEKIASRKQLEKLAIDRKASIESAQESLLGWRKTNDIWDLGQLTQAHSAQIGTIEQEKEGLERQLLAVDSELNNLAGRQRRGLPPPDANADERRALEGLVSQQETLQRELDDARKIYNDSSRVVLQLQADLEEVSASVQREAEVLHRFTRGSVANKRSNLLRQLQGLDAQLNTLKQDKDLAKAQVELKRLEYELSVSERNYAEILEKIDQAKVEEQAKRNEANFTIIERPAPGSKFGGISGGGLNYEKLGSVVVFGLIVAVSGTLLLGTLGATFSLRNQVEMLGLPILGVIPKVGKDFQHDAFVNHPNSNLAAQVRKMIVNIVRKDEKLNRILVTSCWPSEGKSFVSANLAAALTKFQLKVTLVDADLRKPFLTSFFEQKGVLGLRQALVGECPVEELTQPSGVDNLNFLPSGIGDADPTELLHRSANFESLSDRDDKFLVIDSAPLSVCSDAIQLSDEVDGVIVVVSAKYWTGKAELEYILDLEEQGVKILGVILNGVKESELTYYSYYKKAYQSYQADSSSKSRV